MTQALTNSILQLLATHQNKDVRQRHQGQQLNIWQLSSQAIQCKEKIITTLLESSYPFFMEYSESPIDNEIPGNWQQFSTNVWQIDSNLTTANFFKWSYLGGWLLYITEKPVISPWPNIFKDEPIQLEQFFTEHNIPIVITSFWDDIDWTIFITNINNTIQSNE